MKNWRRNNIRRSSQNKKPPRGNFSPVLGGWKRFTNGTDEHPKIYSMKLWATNQVLAKSKFW